MTTKMTGLAAFTRKPKIEAADEAGDKPTHSKMRTRGKNESVALTVRLTRQQWERLHQLALSDGVSLQQLMLQGVRTLFLGRGLPEI